MNFKIDITEHVNKLVLEKAAEFGIEPGCVVEIRPKRENGESTLNIVNGISFVSQDGVVLDLGSSVVNIERVISVYKRYEIRERPDNSSEDFDKNKAYTFQEAAEAIFENPDQIYIREDANNERDLGAQMLHPKTTDLDEAFLVDGMGYTVVLDYENVSKKWFRVL